VLSYLGYLTGIVGTGIWGLVRLRQVGDKWLIALNGWVRPKAQASR